VALDHRPFGGGRQARFRFALPVRTPFANVYRERVRRRNTSGGPFRNGACSVPKKKSVVIRKSTSVALLCFAAVCGRAADGLDVARSALADKLYGVAERQALLVLTTPGPPDARSDALLVYLQALAEQGQHAEVLKVLDSHKATVDAGPAASFAYWRALARLATGDAAGARAAAEAGLAAQPGDADSHALRRVAAQGRLALGDGPGALALYAELDAAVADPALRAALLLEWARALDGMGRAADATAVLARQPRDLPADPHVEQGTLLQARLLARLDRRDEAEQVLRAMAADARSDESGRVQALVQLARLQFEGGRVNDAVSSARAADAAARMPDLRLIAGFRLGEILLSATNTLEEGESRMKSLVREFPEAPEAREAQLRLAAALFEAGRYERAADAYQIYIESFGETGRGLDALDGRARALFMLGRFGEAANLYQKAHDTATNTLHKAESSTAPPTRWSQTVGSSTPRSSSAASTSSTVRVRSRRAPSFSRPTPSNATTIPPPPKGGSGRRRNATPARPSPSRRCCAWQRCSRRATRWTPP